MTSQETEKYVVAALAAFPDQGLRTAELLRLADKYAVGDGVTQFMSGQLVRVAVERLWLNNPDKYFRREVVPSDGSVYRAGQKIWIYSLTNPVPTWSIETKRAIQKLAPRGARTNPLLKAPGVQPGTVLRRRDRQSEPSSERAELIVTLVRELGKDADQFVDVTQFERTIDHLNAQVKQLRQERDDARQQIRQIAKAQQTIQQVLGGR